MRHNKHHASLGVTREHRRAMLSNLAASLITHGRIQTTLTKAKALRPFVEKVVTKAKRAAAKTEVKDAIHLRRLALADVRDETAITKLFNETHKEFTNRNGGYTRIYKLGARQSDAAEIALIEFVKADDPGYKKSKGGRKSAKKTGGRTKAAKPAKSEAATEEPKTDAAPAADVSAETATKPETPKAGGEAKN
jgi:large subunit ribosomal protein L17